MAPKYEEGQNVRYKIAGNADSNTPETLGTIKAVVTEDKTKTVGKSKRRLSASEDSPRYEITNANTGKTSSIRETSIVRKA